MGPENARDREYSDREKLLSHEKAIIRRHGVTKSGGKLGRMRAARGKGGRGEQRGIAYSSRRRAILTTLYRQKNRHLGGDEMLPRRASNYMISLPHHSENAGED